MRRLPPSLITFLGVPLLLAAVVAVLGGASVLRRFESFQPLGFEAVRSGEAWKVVAVTEPATGLREGDLILAVGNLPVGGGGEVRRRLLAEPAAELLVNRGEVLETVSYRRPGLDVDVGYLVLAFSGVVYLLIGLFTVSRHRRAQGFLFFLWCLASATLYLLGQTPPFDGLGKALFVGDELARLFLPPLTLHLFLVFPGPLGGRRLQRLLPFVYLPAAVLATLQADLILFDGGLLFGGAGEAQLLALDRIGIYHLGAFALLALAALALRLGRAGDLEERRQLRWISIGLGAGYLPFILLHAVPRALALDPPEPVNTLAVVPLALVPLTFAYAILRYKLWDIEVIVRNTISLTLTLLLGVLGFGLANLAISRGVPEHLAQARTMLSFVAGLVIAGLLVPAHRGVSSSLERLQYRGSFRKRRALSELGRDLLHERDLDHLCAGLLDHLEDAMEVERSNLYLTQGEAMVAVRPHPGLPPQLPFDVLRDEGWAGAVSRLQGLEPLSGRPSPALELYRKGYRYAFPLVVRGSRVGLVLTGNKLGQAPLSSEDVEIVRQLLNQAALAIENAQLLDQLHQRLEEVLRLKQHNEGIIESSPAGLAVLDAAGRVSSANLAFAALVGRERREVVGEAIGTVLAVPIPGPGEGMVEARHRPPGGEERNLQLTVSFLGGAVGGQRILMVQDVTERVAIENELKEKDRLASLGMLAAGVAHEVNTPITGISSYAQMLLESTPEDDPRHALLKKVERQTFRAARIVGSLLEFARNRRGGYGRVALAPLIDEVLGEVEERLAERGIEVDWQPPSEEVVVHGSHTELVQVFTNLVANAIDAMSGGGTLSLRLEARSGRVCAAVEDTGVGIAPSELKMIFQPFYSTKLAAGGTGLGLSIGFEIVRRHGGEIRVDSTPGEGSRFVVELPRYREDAR